jgi:MarR family transcriptional regulator for hemolysin
MGSTAAPQLSPNLVALLAQASHVLETELTAALASLGISPRQYCVLLNATRGELSQIRLAELCGVDKTTMVVTVDELEKAGLAERRPSATDRRARLIAVTEAGVRLIAEAHAVADAIYADVLAALPSGEREAFLSGLVRLAGGRLSTPVPCDRQVRRRSPKA